MSVALCTVGSQLLVTIYADCWTGEENPRERLGRMCRNRDYVWAPIQSTFDKTSECVLSPSVQPLPRSIRPGEASSQWPWLCRWHGRGGLREHQLGISGLGIAAPHSTLGGILMEMRDYIGNLAVITSVWVPLIGVLLVSSLLWAGEYLTDRMEIGSGSVWSRGLE